YTYQWLKNDVAIPNATGTSVALTNVPLSESGSRYACRVTNPYGDNLTSSNAILTVIQDTFKPVAYAVGSLRGTNIGVYFRDDNLLDPVTAGDPANYTVNNGAITVIGATVEPDRLAVILSLSAPVSGAFSVAIKNVKDAAPIPNTIDTITLQSSVVTWPLNQDIGSFTGTPPVFSDPIMPGFAQAIGTNGFYVHAGGGDIWNAADGMHFVYQPISGNFDVAVRVTGLRMADAWSKAGLMLRADLDATSRNYLIATTPSAGNNLLTMQWRPDKNVATLSLPDNMRPRPSLIPNAWLRITRADQVFSFYYGTNGTDWVTFYTTNEVATPYPSSVYVGLATTSHNNGNSLTNTTGAYFQDLTGFTLPVVARPALVATVQGANLVLSWTTTDASFKLQSTATVAIGWANDPAVPVVAGNNYTVTVPLSTGAKFYRLSK
ncbi:MAG TPA: hypothetical protein VNZ22_14495, partial [Bacillota bacterium]|nr:hypothetical protein [Bacillota bacterium]